MVASKKLNNDLPWNLSYKKASEAQPSWTKHGMPTLAGKFINLVKKSGIRDGVHLDIGCGNGIKTVNFALAGLKTVGIDMSSDGFSDGRKLIRELRATKKCKLIYGSALKIPLEDNSAYSVSDILCFTHLKAKDYKTYKNEVYRVLKNGGYFFLLLFSDSDKHFHGHKVSRQYTFCFNPHNPIMEDYAHYHGMYNIHFNEAHIRKVFKDKFEIVDIAEVQHPVYDYRYLWNVILRRK